MKLYKVSMNGDFGDTDGYSQWSPSKRDAQMVARVMTEMANDKSLPKATIEEVEFLPTRTDLVRMLNRHASRG